MKIGLRHFLAIAIAFSAWPLQAKPSLVQQAIRAWENNDLDQAQTLIDQATNEEAASGAAWYYRGAIYENLLRKKIANEDAPQRFEATLTAYRQALALLPNPSQYHSFVQINLNNLWAYYLDRGRRYYRQEAFDKAIEQWQYCQQIKADEPCLELYRAIATHQNEQYEVARQHYHQYLAQTKEAPAGVYRALAHLTAELDKAPEKGIAIIEQGLAHAPFDHELLYEQQALYQKMEQGEALKQQLEQKIAAAPQEAAYYYQLGYWYEQQGQPEQALPQYQKASELAPKRLEPTRQQGMLHYNRAAQLTQKIHEMPDEAFQEQGVALKQELTSALEQALPFLEQARRLQPRDAETLRCLELLHAYQAMPEEPNLLVSEEEDTASWGREW